MKLHKLRAVAVAAGATALYVSGGTVALAAAITGPSSSDAPYVVRSQPGVVTKSILTVGDEVPKAGGGTYRMVGIPDGLGAFDNGDGTFTLLSNHELNAMAGIVRAHGAKGAFVSRWTISEDDLTVESGEDLIQQIATWNATTSTYNAPAKGVVLGRLCSATLAPVSAFFNAASGRGYEGRIFTDGEEVGAEGRALGHTLGGTSYELPAVGKLSFENVVPNPATGDRTVTVGLDDATGGQVYVYAGDKQTAGNPVERAGLANGRLYGIKVAGFPAEVPASGIPSGTRFSGVDLGDVRNFTGAALQTASVATGVTGFLRPEDGAWDPTDAHVFYFATTASFTGKSRLWRLRFDDPANPAAGGRIDMVLDGTEGQKMLDNLTINDRGQVLLQEDPGEQAYVARLWLYSPKADQLSEIAHFDPGRFLAGGADFLTEDEESSGIIDASQLLGRGWYLLDAQAHYPMPGELVEGGQYLALHVPYGRYPS
jgi:hypothetical protein